MSTWDYMTSADRRDCVDAGRFPADPDVFVDAIDEGSNEVKHDPARRYPADVVKALRMNVPQRAQYDVVEAHVGDRVECGRLITRGNESNPKRKGTPIKQFVPPTTRGTVCEVGDGWVTVRWDSGRTTDVAPEGGDELYAAPEPYEVSVLDLERGNRVLARQLASSENLDAIVVVDYIVSNGADSPITVRYTDRGGFVRSADVPRTRFVAVQP